MGDCEALCDTAGGGSYPRVPEKLSKHHQVSRVEGEAHVGCCDGQHSHAAPVCRLEPVAQQLAICRRGGPIYTDVADVLQRWGKIELSG